MKLLLLALGLGAILASTRGRSPARQRRLRGSTSRKTRSPGRTTPKKDGSDARLLTPFMASNSTLDYVRNIYDVLGDNVVSVVTSEKIPTVAVDSELPTDFEKVGGGMHGWSDWEAIRTIAGFSFADTNLSADHPCQSRWIKTDGPFNCCNKRDSGEIYNCVVWNDDSLDPVLIAARIQHNLRIGMWYRDVAEAVRDGDDDRIKFLANRIDESFEISPRLTRKLHRAEEERLRDATFRWGESELRQATQWMQEKKARIIAEFS